MSIWRTFNSLSIRGVGGGAVSAGNGAPPVPPGTLLTFLSGPIGVQQSIEYYNGMVYIPCTQLSGSFQIPKFIISNDNISFYLNDLSVAGSAANSTVAPSTIISSSNIRIMPYFGANPAVHGVYYSSDGLSWTKNNNYLLTTATSSPSSIFDGTYNIHITNANTSGLTNIFYTTDGINYLSKQLTIDVNASPGIYYLNNQYIVTGTSNIYTSSTIDGTYTTKTVPPFGGTAARQISDILYVDGQYYFEIYWFNTGTNQTDSRFVRTADFNTYTTISSVTNKSIIGKRGILYKDGFFYAVHPRISSSVSYVARRTTSATTWTILNNFTSTLSYNLLTYATNSFVVAGSNTQFSRIVLATSADGTTWTQRV
jgi:hypothetical protein